MGYARAVIGPLDISKTKTEVERFRGTQTEVDGTVLLGTPIPPSSACRKRGVRMAVTHHEHMFAILEQTCFQRPCPPPRAAAT